MARGRDIKPGFFLSDELAEVSRDARLFFVGLWTLADRAGRFEVRPVRIKAQLFPYDADITPARVESMLLELSNAQGKHLLLYEVDGKRYCEIRNFSKHQHIHPNEAKSDIPGPMGVPGITGAVRELPESSGNSALPSVPSSLQESEIGPPEVVPRNEPGKPSPRNVVARYLALRAEIVVGHVAGAHGLSVQPQESDVDKAATWLSGVPPDVCADIEPAMRLACEHVRDGTPGWNKPEMAKVGYLFGCIVRSWPDLREELHGCAPKLANLKKAPISVGEKSRIREW